MLTPITENLWHVPFTVDLPLGMKLPAQMTVIRLENGRLVLHSPVPITDALATELAGLGDVACLIAPNALHHRYLGAASERFPRARVLAAPGVAAKQPGLRIDEQLGAEAPPEYRAELEQLQVAGAPSLNEFVFFHRASRTLIVTDLVFNVVEPPNLMAALVLTLTGTRGKLAQSRAWRSLTRDRAALSASIARVFEWDFDRLVPAHGAIVETGAASALGKVLAHLVPRPGLLESAA